MNFNFKSLFILKQLINSYFIKPTLNLIRNSLSFIESFIFKSFFLLLFFSSSLNNWPLIRKIKNNELKQYLQWM